MDEAKTREQLLEEIDRLRKEVDRLKVAAEDTGGSSGNRSAGTDSRSAGADRSRFEAIIENTPMVGVQSFDRDGVIHYWNGASKQLYGFSAAEVSGKRIQDLIIPAEETDAFEAALKEISDTRAALPCSIWKARTKDGGEKWIYSSLFPVLERGEIAEIFCMDVDVTDRKAMEATLRENEEQLRTLINAMPDIVCFKDGQGRWLAANDFDLRLFEIGHVDYRGRKDSELAEYSGFYRDAFLACEESDEAAWRQGKTSRADEVIPKPGGSALTFDVIKVPLFHPDGSRKGLVVIGRDITESKRAQAELKRSYDRMEIMVAERTAELSRARNTLKTILDTVPVGVVMAESDAGCITYFSPSAVRILGLAAQAGPYDSIPPSYLFCKMDGSPLPLEENPLLRSLKEGVQVHNYEAIVRREDGTEVPLLISSAPIKDSGGHTQAVVANLIDVTELNRAENALKDSEQFLKNVFDGIQDGISVLDKDLNVLRVNHTMEKLYPAMVPLAGKKCYYAYHNRTVPCEKCPTLRAMRTKSLQSEIVPIVHADQSRGWLELYAFPLIDGAGSVTGVVEHVREVTDRMIAEKELREAKAQSELYLDLMGHDINNMHQIALGYLELARDLHPEAGQTELLNKPIEVLHRSTQLIHNVRKLQKLKEGVFRTQEVDLCQLLADVQREFGAVPHKAISLNLSGCEHCRVRANELLHDVFANLVNNAIKHTGDKADIVIDLDVVTENDDHVCRVTVEDNGPGIPDDFKLKIFNRMLKGSDKAKGMGLGLYLVKSLVDSYGGRVWAEDRVPGDYTQGARFVVMLPAAKSEGL
ncbi:MAG: sensory histidine kinase AtoS [Methanocella sp. PtaU1.Bin125]|nr:MAG: sensory histidine kinase AtoS [Methanocella sp. PtaU1.Bin125]